LRCRAYVFLTNILQITGPKCNICTFETYHFILAKSTREQINGVQYNTHYNVSVKPAVSASPIFGSLYYPYQVVSLLEKYAG
jgi:hypothetical protein